MAVEGRPRLKAGVTEFAIAASRLAGLAGALLGWRPAEFWTATPAELATILAALAPRHEAPAGSDVLAELQERFPDG
nr:phage tail assembly chaperone [Sphingomonas horti]